MSIEKIGPMANPPHPGGIVRDILGDVSLSAAEAAERLGVTRSSLLRLLDRETGISPALAAKLERQGWSTAETWLRMQAAYDSAQARKRAAKSAA